MPRIIKSCLSREDFLEIWLYVARDNPTAADRLIQKFDRHLESLARAPMVGRS
jgi:toxin ParE1/3/4